MPIMGGGKENEVKSSKFYNQLDRFMEERPSRHNPYPKRNVWLKGRWGQFIADRDDISIYTFASFR